MKKGYLLRSDFCGLKRVPFGAEFCDFMKGYEDIECCYSVGNKMKYSLFF